jgi:hypothetical protein
MINQIARKAQARKINPAKFAPKAERRAAEIKKSRNRFGYYCGCTLLFEIELSMRF